MLKKKIHIIGLLVLPFVFLMFSNRVTAERECWDGPGGGPTNPGNSEYPPGWLCQCPPEFVFGFDNDSTPDTITSGGSIDVYVRGGCAPFTYEVSGNGYTWDVNDSTSYVSNNRNERLDCASGT